jgi:serine/threonine-protein kinase
MDLQERLQTALASTYRVERELGGGGMSRVFVATEIALNRRVVIKVLPPELAAGLSVERFRREIQLAASLQHPHIVPLLAAGPADDMLYYTMPFIVGESLRTKITREGELPIGETVRILRDVVDALACAHEHGIVHRDIKPDNVLVSRHHGLVADFGVAKALSDATGAGTVTSTGLALGTPAYMAPEQATAMPNIDHRADLYAVGALGYEMLTGHPPFTGSSAQAVLAAQVTQHPEPVIKQRASVPQALSALIMRCLEKRPADRFQSADELLHLLESMATPTAGTTPTKVRRAVRNPVLARLRAIPGSRALYLGLGALIVLGLGWSLTRSHAVRPAEPPGEVAKSVVVLPFENLGPPEDEYFADGVTEEITNRLTGIGGLRVISRNSARQYKTTQKPLRQIGQELGVAYALVGTVRWSKAGDSTQVRVSPELIRVSDGSNVWAHGYDAVVAGIFQVQSDIAEQVAAALNVALAAPERRALAAQPTRNPEAYTYYLKGQQYLDQGYSARNLGLAESLYVKAVEADSEFALAWAALSLTHDQMYWFYYDRTEHRLILQKETADRALSLDPDLAEGHVALAMYEYHAKYDFAAALRELDLARQIQPSNSDVYAATGLVQRRQGKWKEAYENQKRSVDLDPRSVTTLNEAAITALSLNDLAQAERYFNQGMTMAPDQSTGYSGAAEVALRRGDMDHALTLLRAGLQRAGVGNMVRNLSRTRREGMVYLLVNDGHLPEMDRLDLSTFQDDTIAYYLWRSDLHRYLKHQAAARAYADSLLRVTEPLVRSQPDASFYHIFLASAYANEGRKADAIKEAKTAVSILPLSKDRFGGQGPIWFLARTYMVVGEPDSAAAQLGLLLSMPSGVSPTYLKLDPLWAPLRGHVSFEKLIANH